MRVFKFGGASIKSADAIRNMAGIIRDHRDGKLIVVVSAMGKTTNRLESILHHVRTKRPFQEPLEALKQYHLDICHSLFTTSEMANQVTSLFEELVAMLERVQSDDYDLGYDQTVSFGELLSSAIVDQYLRSSGFNCEKLMAPDVIVTDDSYREAIVNWKATLPLILQKVQAAPSEILVTQGFIGGHGQTRTTLGREGSDYSAAIFAVATGAQSLTVWKDVPGIMSADPALIPEATKYDELSYREASEMTYYGAKVIHPDTIQPLAENGIELQVKSFTDPSATGTLIHDCTATHSTPCIIYKQNQCLLSFRFNDYNFIDEQHLVTIYDVLDKLHIHVSMMQNSATSFSVCIDDHPSKIETIIDQLKDTFVILYNRSLQLLTIKNYNQATLDQYGPKSGILLEQKSRADIQIVYQQEP